ncbi:MAG TPA: enoyl-CoA hydratase/isomerase family protein [Burkholderiales bacterium]|nr:enoyl-CoA hydratase/isomerase family protein [Burkholderiales bacterium]
MTETNSQPVLFEERRANNGARAGVARLNVEKTLNSLSLEMIDLLFERMSVWATDADIAFVVLEGTGEKAFCAGADLHNLYRTMLQHHGSARRDDIRGNAYALDFFSREYRLDYLIHTYPKPVLCWGHGIVMGGGLGLMSGASHRVVTESSRVAMPEITIGLYPDVGGTWLLNRAPVRSGLFLALTGAQLNGADTVFAGFADYQIAHADKARVMESLMRQPWTANAANGYRLLTDVLRSVAMARPVPGPLREHIDVISELCGYATLPEIVAAITGLKTQDAWLAKAAATLAAGSPGSAALSHALQRRMLHSSLAEVFRVELVASLTCATRPDLAEGIRALLIDKDRRPRWRLATLADVTPEWLEGFFRSPWQTHEHPLAGLGA